MGENSINNGRKTMQIMGVNSINEGVNENKWFS